MDRRRAAAALLALAACIASSAAAPTANNHTALDLYDEPTEGCYYNFQHYGEGDRIMTNEPCLNCTCHNRMLMCYLRVCPFTKAIGQDCTVEKRADQCCPIVTCPDVPVDLLTSTSTSSPAEYGGTGVGKVDKYGCSINGKYFTEGAKVPPSPGKPCEHCYCIRNMTTCVMQECTLHVDGCTPIYHKDVCCPVRYFCDHPEDEIPLLDDMTTTVRPTPGFLLTTTAPTEAPTTTTQPARRDCIDDDQLYPDGALIKTDKPCEHCYCMKGDIVCVVQECGTPMENEGKNCTSLPPREGQCCPDTYICEGDELNTEPLVTQLPFEESVTTIVPPRRVSIEGSGYRNEPDEMAYTEAPTFATELEGSGEDELAEKPEKEPSDRFEPTEEGEFIPLTTQVPISEGEKATTEPDKGLNTVPIGSLEEESTDNSQQEKTTLRHELGVTEPTRRQEHSTEQYGVTTKEEQSLIPSSATAVPVEEKITTVSSVISEKEGTEPSVKETTLKEEQIVTESPVISETESHISNEPDEESITVISVAKEPLPTETAKPTDLPSVNESSTESAEDEHVSEASRSSTPDVDNVTSPKSVEEETEKIETDVPKYTTLQDKLGVTESMISEHNTVPVSAEEEQSSETYLPEDTTMHNGPKSTEPTSTAEQENIPVRPLEDVTSGASDFEKSTVSSDITSTEVSIKAEEKPTDEITTVISKEEKVDDTTELSFKKEEEVTTPIESVTLKQLETSTISAVDLTKETVEISDKETSPEILSTAKPKETGLGYSSIQPEIEQKTTPVKESSTESIMELSTFAHISDNEPVTVSVAESEATPTITVTEKVNLLETTTINPSDNEIAEGPAPGRIPGEGDCLLDGTTFKNYSIVPSTNKCHTGCKCVSSIIKCDPIVCSPPPENMDNCQPRYDTPESCCPNYVCDHGMETIPPQPQSHITETESSTPSTIECHGDECKTVEEKQPSQEPAQTANNLEPSECGSSGCEHTVQIPSEPCIDNKCEVSHPPSELEHAQEYPIEEVPQSCVNPEDCKYTKVPTPCEGKSCTSQDEVCDKEGGCVIEPDVIPQEDTSQVCANEEECKQDKIPQLETASCEGESCTNVKQDCSTGECKVISSLPQPSHEGEICSEERGCNKPEITAECKNGKCDHKEVDDRTGVECSGGDCMQQEPILPTQETTQSGPMSTQASEEVTPKQQIIEYTTKPSLPGLPTTLSEGAVTASPTVHSDQDEEVKEPESQVSDEEKRVTKLPDENVTSYISEVTSGETIDIKQEITVTPSEKVTGPQEIITQVPLESTTTGIKISELESPESIATEAPTNVIDVESTEEKTDRPDDVLETLDIITHKPEIDIKKETELSTVVPQQQYDEVRPTIMPETPVSEEDKATNAPEIVDGEREHVAISTASPVTETERENMKPEHELEKTPTEPSVSEVVTEKFTEKTTKIPESAEASSENAAYSEAATKATEPSTQKPQESEMSSVSEGLVTKTELSTESPGLYEELTTTSYEKETVSVEGIQTEAPEIDITESQGYITEAPKEGTEYLSTVIPERSGAEEPIGTTTQVSDVSQPISLATTKLPEIKESDDKEITTEVPMQPSIVDKNIPKDHVPSEQEMYEAHSVETPTPQVETEIPPLTDRTSENESYSTTPETISIEVEKKTGSPLLLVTEQPHDDHTTISVITESSVIPEMLSVEPQDDVKTQAPESHVTVSLEEAEITIAPIKSVTERELFTDKINTVEPEKQPTLTANQELTTEPSFVVTKPVESFVTKIQEPIIKTPPVPKTEAPVIENKETEVTYETESPEVQHITTSVPLLPPASEEVVGVITESHEPTVTEEYEMSTGEPDKKEHDTLIPEVTQFEPQEAVAKEPELPETEINKPSEETEDMDQENITSRPIFDKVSEIPQSTEQNNVQTDLPISVTESQEITQRIPEEKGSSEIPSSEYTVTPEEIITKESITEKPELYTTTGQGKIETHEYLTTISPLLVVTEVSKPTKQPFVDSQTELPKPESPETHEPETQRPTTNISEEPVDEEHTELISIETSATSKPEQASPEISEATTIVPQIQEEDLEDKQTEKPILVTDSSSSVSQEEATIAPVREEPNDINRSTESVPEGTISPEDASTTIPDTDEKQKSPQEPEQTSRPEVEHSETTPYLVELEEHTHKMDEEEPTIAPTEGPSVSLSEEPAIVATEEPTISPLGVPIAPIGESVAASEKPTTTPLEVSIVPIGESTVAPSKESTTFVAEEPTISPSGETPIVPIAESTIALPGETTVAASEESTVPPLKEIPVAPIGESTVAPSEENTVAATQEPSTPSLVEASGAPIEESSVSPQEEATVTSYDEPTNVVPEEPTTFRTEMDEIESHTSKATTDKSLSDEKHTELPEIETERPSGPTDKVPSSTASIEETTDIVKPTDVLVDKYGGSDEDEKEVMHTTQKEEEEAMTPIPSHEIEKPALVAEPETDVTVKPVYVPVETTAPEDEFIPVTAKATTAKSEEETSTQPPPTKPAQTSAYIPPSTAAPEVSKPDELQPTDEVPAPEDESHFPPSGGYNQEPDYVEEDQAFGPGTCRYGGKVYVSAQQIPRDDPCDFCFCFRSDIICLQQSCPPPIHGCHEEPIQGFCCPRYECPVSMATSLNVTTTTTTTTTTLPPHFLPHAYKGAAQRKGCQIKGHTYQVGEVVRASSGPCLHCTCGGDGQMKCDPKQCTPEPMLRQMIAAAVSAKRRR